MGQYRWLPPHMHACMASAWVHSSATAARPSRTQLLPQHATARGAKSHQHATGARPAETGRRRGSARARACVCSGAGTTDSAPAASHNARECVRANDTGARVCESVPCALSTRACASRACCWHSASAGTRQNCSCTSTPGQAPLGKWVGDAKQILLQAVIDGRHLCFRPMFFKSKMGLPLTVGTCVFGLCFLI